MATKPTRFQDRACDQLAEALLLITESARLDGSSRFGAGEVTAVAEGLARASSAFPREEIVARALERRGRALGLRSGTAEVILLVGGDRPPLELLLLDDDEFRAAVAALESELGDV